MQPECLETRTMQSGKRKRESFTVVHEHMTSLEEYGFPMYAAYSSDETDMYRPRKIWNLLVPGRTNVRRMYRL